jgi:hypothetical protein
MTGVAEFKDMILKENIRSGFVRVVFFKSGEFDDRKPSSNRSSGDHE